MDLFKKRLPIILLIIGSIAVLALEPVKYGFEFIGHLGWVSSHVAAQVIKATAENSFVGYTLKIANSGTVDLYYFDRYPILFSAFMNTILKPFESNLGWWVLMSKYFMDIIFFGTIIYAYRITGYLTADVFKRCSIVLLSFSGFYFLNYKAMIHFDQPAILGSTALIDAIFCFERKKDKKSLIVWSIFSSLLGRGYANLFILSLYFVLKVLKDREYQCSFLLFKVTLLPAGIICSSLLAFNVYMEAKIRNVTINDVSIVKSARSRLGIEKFPDAKVEESVGWGNFLQTQGHRIRIQYAPAIFSKNTAAVFLILSLLIAGLMVWKNRKEWTQEEIFAVTLLFLSGPVWLFPLKRLAHFHDYTTMYYWGASLALYYMLMKHLRRSLPVFILSLLLASASLLQVMKKHRKTQHEVNAIASELHQIRLEIHNNRLAGKVISFQQGMREVLKGRPYIMGFYFYDWALSDVPTEGQYLVSNIPLNRSAIYSGKFLYLYKN